MGLAMFVMLCGTIFGLDLLESVACIIILFSLGIGHGVLAAASTRLPTMEKVDETEHGNIQGVIAVWGQTTPAARKVFKSKKRQYVRRVDPRSWTGGIAWWEWHNLRKRRRGKNRKKVDMKSIIRAS